MTKEVIEKFELTKDVISLKDEGDIEIKLCSGETHMKAVMKKETLLDIMENQGMEAAIETYLNSCRQLFVATIEEFKPEEK